MNTRVSTLDRPMSNPGVKSLQAWMRIVGPFLGLAVVIAIFAGLNENPLHYLSPANIRIVFSQTVIVALGAIGMTMIIVSGGIDLSVGSAVALTGVVSAIVLRDGGSPFTAAVAGILAGGIIGLVNALTITRLRVVPFIGTLGMLGIARGVAKWIANQQTVNIPSTWLNQMAVS